MRLEKIKEMLKSKQGIIVGAVIGVLVISGITGLVIHNKNNGNEVVENNQVATSKEEVSKEEIEAKEQLEALKQIDISKLVEEDKKTIESKISEIEKLITNKDYTKAKTDIEILKNDINTKVEELAKKEEVKEENKSDKVEENKDKEVASNSTNNSNSSTSSNTSNNSTGNGGSSSSSNQEVVQKPTTPPVTEKPVQPTPEPTPQPKPPVEPPKPVYPSVGEVKERLISYGQSLGLKYDPSLVTEGWSKRDTSQMWSSELGNSTDGQRLFNGFEYDRFAIVVTDLGEFCSMEIYAPWE